MEIFIARQPIFNRNRHVFGYELLFRDGLANYFRHHDLNEAASRVIADSTFLFGIDKVAGGRKAFVNITREMLVRDHAALLPKHNTVLEILETVEPDAEVVAACRRLKKQGYTLALDDFVWREEYTTLMDLVDIVKIDWLSTTDAEKAEMIPRLQGMDKILLAEKLETEADFDNAFSAGFHFFQGYFFCRPTILSRRNLAGNRLIYLQMLKEIHRPELNYHELERLIGRDLTLSYKLLRYINSAFFSLRNEIHSIRHALVLLGEEEIKKWATLLSLSTMAEERTTELMTSATVRARMSELLAERCGEKKRKPEFFLMGLFTVIDVLLDRPLMEILLEIPLVKDLKKALLHRGKGFHRDVLETVLAYERGDWAAVAQWSPSLDLPEPEIAGAYVEAVEWARHMQE
ncbi:HDOD domain-containing protein [Sulfidibacter corallicola]|uniref:HDOD domain-containing protein n=1 Tax=Sulfidibacter corallicola TaxID=2818388 RepID=A0A8A4THQ4_SULCO|nr:HDOD domain-containing protein [Sulfidibacter corallicola]QTD49080.1 HDOD domain-containing protein [Sulfidibacter corallicola]